MKQSINFTSWECHPFTKGSDFLVAVLANAKRLFLEPAFKGVEHVHGAVVIDAEGIRVEVV